MGVNSERLTCPCAVRFTTTAMPASRRPFKPSSVVTPLAPTASKVSRVAHTRGGLGRRGEKARGPLLPSGEEILMGLTLAFDDSCSILSTDRLILRENTGHRQLQESLKGSV